MQLTQTVVPLVPVGTIDDSEFPDGDAAPWIAAFVSQITASRAVGTLCRGRAYVSPDLAVRMYGETPMADFGEWNSPLQLASYGPESQRLVVFADIDLAANSARIE